MTGCNSNREKALSSEELAARRLLSREAQDIEQPDLDFVLYAQGLMAEGARKEYEASLTQAERDEAAALRLETDRIYTPDYVSSLIKKTQEAADNVKPSLGEHTKAVISSKSANRGKSISEQ